MLELNEVGKSVGLNINFQKIVINDLVDDIDNNIKIEKQETESRPLRLSRTKNLVVNLKRRNKMKKLIRIEGLW